VSDGGDRNEDPLLVLVSEHLVTRPVGAWAGKPLLRDRLLATLGSPDRFAPFFEQLQALVGLDLRELKLQLNRIDGPQDPGWQRAPFPGVRYLDFPPGPTAGVLEAGLVRVAAGAHFPRHEHVARERACVLEGRLILEGRTHHPGTVVDSPAGSSHEFDAGPERDLVLIVAHGGIRFGRGS
jgi:quercetin dioxygenase-like cupin family protein